MTERTQTAFEFPSVKKRKVRFEFTGGEITSDGGILLLCQADRLTGLMRAINAAITDPRDPDRVVHDQLSLLRQRVYALACGYEDLNDHQTLRHDPAIQPAVEHDERLASASTLCRLEPRTGRAAAVALHQVLVDRFIASCRRAPKKLVLDFDATDDPVHGTQQGRFFHGYYDHYCFLPLYVFCGDRLLVSHLRPSKIDAAKHAWAILALLVKRLRQAWPKVRIIFRGDSGFCRWRLLAWCERHDVGYIVGIAKNARLEAKVARDLASAAACHRDTGQKVRRFRTFAYAARSWDRPRCIVAKIEHLHKGPNLRFVVTNLPGLAQRLYEEVYCARGEMENRIKEQQLSLFADGTSSHYWWANQLRLLLSSLAYTLIETIRRRALAGTQLARAQVTTLRLRLLKIGAVIMRNTRRIRFLLSSAYPDQALFLHAAAKLTPG